MEYGERVETSNTHKMRIKSAFVVVVICDYSVVNVRQQLQCRYCQVPVIHKISLSKYVQSIRLNNMGRDERGLRKQLLIPFTRTNNEEEAERRNIQRQRG